MPADAARFDDEVISTVVHVMGGSFGRLYRLLAQVERILDINQLDQVTRAVMETCDRPGMTPNSYAK